MLNLELAHVSVYEKYNKLIYRFKIDRAKVYKLLNVSDGVSPYDVINQLRWEHRSWLCSLDIRIDIDRIRFNKFP